MRQRVDLHKYFVEMPAPLWAAIPQPKASLPDLSGEQRTKPVPPQPHGPVADVDPALSQHILDIAQRQRVADIEQYRQADDLGGAVEILERARYCGRLRPAGDRSQVAWTVPSGELLRYLNGLRMGQATARCRRAAISFDKATGFAWLKRPRSYGFILPMREPPA